MKFDKIQLQYWQANPLVELPMYGDLSISPYIVKDIQGLDSPDMSVFVENTTDDFSLYRGRKVSPRQVVIKIGLNPDWGSGQDVQSLRAELYKFMSLPHQDLMTVRLVDSTQGNLEVGEIYGTMSKLETPLFSREPEVQVTIEATHPYIEAPSTTFLLPTLTPNGSDTEWMVNYPGTAKTGFWMGIQFDTASTGTVQLISDNSGQRMDINQDFAAGERLIVNALSQGRGVWRVFTDSTTTNILHKLTPDSVWPQLTPGESWFRINKPNLSWYGGTYFTSRWMGV